MTHVIDDALRQTPKVMWNWRPVAQALSRARRFILTDNASTQLGKIMGVAEDLILKNHQFALAPYDVTYIEVNTRLLYEAAGKETTASRDFNVDGDERVGYLMAYGQVWVCSRTLKNHATMSPFIFSSDGMRRRVSDPALSNLDTDIQNLILFLGSGINALTDDVGDELLDRWSARHLFTYGKERPNHLVISANGDLRNLLAILLILNQPERLLMTSVGPQAMLHRGKRIVYAAHNVVELELGRTRAYRKLFNHYPVDRQSPRRHEVRGHFVHHPGSARDHCISGHSHSWPTLPTSFTEEGSPRWTCRTCGGHRVWRKNFLRGDAGRGFVTKEYTIMEDKT